MNKKISVTAFSLLLGVVSVTSAEVSLITVGDIDPNGAVPTCLTLSSDLRYRMRDSAGGDVSNLQDFLISSGLMQGESTGYFGAGTIKAVKTFQQKQGLSPTGFVGPLTREKINKISCDDSFGKRPLINDSEQGISKKKEKEEMGSNEGSKVKPRLPIEEKKVEIRKTENKTLGQKAPVKPVNSLSEADKATLEALEEKVKIADKERVDYYIQWSKIKSASSSFESEPFKTEFAAKTNALQTAKSNLEVFRRAIFKTQGESGTKKVESDQR